MTALTLSEASQDCIYWLREAEKLPPGEQVLGAIACIQMLREMPDAVRFEVWAALTSGQREWLKGFRQQGGEA